jgi:signal transduction histidine kinase/ActR/RegA family two-component response regulator
MTRLIELSPAARKDAAALRPGRHGRVLRFRSILIVVFVCGAVWLSALFDALEERRTALDAAWRQQDNVAGALAEQAARSLQAVDLILREAALLDPDRPGGPGHQADVPQMLRRHLTGVPQVRNLFLIDPARRLYLSAFPVGVPYVDISDRSYFTAQQDRDDLGLFISEPLISRTSGEPTFVLSRRLGGSREFHGIVTASVEVAYFRRFYQALDLGSGSSLELLRADGVPLVSRERDHVENETSPWRDAIAALGRLDAAQARLPDAGRGLALVSLRRVPGYPALIAVGRSEHEILAGWRQEAWKGAARTFAITVLALLLLAAFLRQLARHERVTARLQQSQKLEALGTLAGGIAHDFNNILGAVLGYGELAAQHSAAGSPQRSYIDNIVLAANRARDLVARILAFSRPGVNTHEAVVLQEIVAETTGLLRAALPAPAHLELRLPAEPIVVLGDAAQLHQMLGNLVTNAAQALVADGEVDVSLEEVRFDAPRELSIGRVGRGRYACLQVRDTGQGIPEELLAKIFDPFFTTKSVGEGTGLGLSLVHGIVLDHNGAIEVQSRPGVGTSFRVYLPVVRLQPDRASVPAATPLGNGETILVVDDEEMLVRLAEEVLAGLGYEPVGCIGAPQALAAFRADPQRYDALLSDVIMPGLSGPALAAQIHALRPGLPVVLMSGYAGADLQAQAETAGAVAVLLKPLSAADLGRCLAGIFQIPGQHSVARPPLR